MSRLSAWLSIGAGAAFVLCSIGFGAAVASPAPPPYTEQEVTDGGTIAGSARLEGSPPAATPLRIDRDEEACGHEIQPETFVVGENGRLRNAVVWLHQIASGKPIDRSAVATIENAHCRFDPHVQAAVAGSTLEIRNSDPILHNTHLFMGDSSLVNLALPANTSPVRRVLDRPGIVRVECDVHRWMRAYVFVSPHPYFATTDAGGAFRIDQIPAGTYEVRAWHEAASAAPVQVQVPAAGEASVEIVLRPRR